MVAKSSMGRGMEVLRTLGEISAGSAGGSSVTNLARAMGRDRSQVSRVLAALASLGYCERSEMGYRISSSTYAAAQALTERRLRTDGVTVLEMLSAETGEACFLGELFGSSTVTIAESIPGPTRYFSSWIGRAYPAYCSDAGQATLWDATDAEIRSVLAPSLFGGGGPNAPRNVTEFIERLREARERGYSVVDEEAESGLISVAAPVYDYRGEVVAALQIVGARTKLVSSISELGVRCRHAADVLSGRLSGRQNSEFPSDAR